jgi:hypothetical protein
LSKLSASLQEFTTKVLIPLQQAIIATEDAAHRKALTEAYALLAKIHKDLMDFHTILATYDRSTSLPSLYDLYERVKTFRYLLPKKLRAYGPFQWHEALVHRFECKGNPQQ